MVEITIDKNHVGKANYTSEGDLCYEKFDVLINCSGSSGLDKKHLSNLLIQLIESGICMPTPSSHGFVVGDKFDVCDGFYISATAGRKRGRFTCTVCILRKNLLFSKKYQAI